MRKTPTFNQRIDSLTQEVANTLSEKLAENLSDVIRRTLDECRFSERLVEAVKESLHASLNPEPTPDSKPVYKIRVKPGLFGDDFLLTYNGKTYRSTRRRDLKRRARQLGIDVQ